MKTFVRMDMGLQEIRHRHPDFEFAVHPFGFSVRLKDSDHPWDVIGHSGLFDPEELKRKHRPRLATVGIRFQMNGLRKTA